MSSGQDFDFNKAELERSKKLDLIMKNEYRWYYYNEDKISQSFDKITSKLIELKYQKGVKEIKIPINGGKPDTIFITSR